MQRITPILYLAGGIVAVGLALGQSLASSTLASAQDPFTQDPVDKPADDALAAKVQELELKVTALESWVAAQQAQATLTVAALAEAEAAGFTAGINFKSREILLAAWRAEAARVQEPRAGDAKGVAVPKGGVDEKPDGDAPRTPR